MARPLRIEFDGAVYHLTSRGDRREPIFEDDEDRACFLRVLSTGLDRFDVGLIAWCQMGNHYHLVVQTRQSNLSRFMRHLNGVYTQAYNRRHRKVGHLFQGRFKAIVVDTDAYLLEVCRYVDLNPVRAGMTKTPDTWPWSGYRARAGLEPPLIETEDELLRGLLGADDAESCAGRYADWVAAGHHDQLWDRALHGQIYLGSEQFAAAMQARLQTLPSEQVPRIQRRPVRRPLAYYFSEQPSRDAAIRSAFAEGGYTMTEIARHAGLSTGRISRLIREGEARGKT